MSLGFILDRGQRKRALGTRGTDPVEKFKGFKYIRFKEFRAPEGRAELPGGAEAERLSFFCAAAQRFCIFI